MLGISVYTHRDGQTVVLFWCLVLGISVYTHRDGQTVVCYLESCVRYICVYTS